MLFNILYEFKNLNPEQNTIKVRSINLPVTFTIYLLKTEIKNRLITISKIIHIKTKFV